MYSIKKLSLSIAAVGALTLSLLLPGCGSKSYSSAPAAPPPSSSMAASAENGGEFFMGKSNDMMAPQLEASSAASMAPKDGSANSALPPADTSQPRKLVKNSDLMLEAKDFDTAVTSLTKMVEDAGGYLDSQSVDGMSLTNTRSYYERSAILIARVPSDKLDSITDQMGTLCNIVSQSQRTEDISDSYYDAQSRLDMLKIKESRLLDLLSKAEKLEDIIKLEDALGNCQYQLDSLTGRLRRMDNQVSYSTMNITINEVVEYKEMQTQPKNFGEQLVDAAKRSGKRLISSIEGILLGVVELGPVFLLDVAIILGIVYLCYRLLRWKMQRRSKVKASSDTVSPPQVPPTDNEDL